MEWLGDIAAVVSAGAAVAAIFWPFKKSYASR
jgi:hypothetical protein